MLNLIKLKELCLNYNLIEHLPPINKLKNVNYCNFDKNDLYKINLFI